MTVRTAPDIDVDTVVDGFALPPGGDGGARLLRALVRQGLDADAYLAAAALVVALDQPA